MYQKYQKILFSIFLLICASHVLPTRMNAQNTICTPDEIRFQGGEKLVYKVYYNWGFIWLNAGELTMEMQDKGDHFVIVGKGYTYPSYSWMFAVDDYYETHVDKKTLQPLRSIKTLKEGNYRLYEKLIFDWDLEQVTGFRGKNKEETSKFTAELDDCSLDLISIMYMLRAINFDEVEIGEASQIVVYLDQKTYKVNFIYRDKNTRDIDKLGKYDIKEFSAAMGASITFGEEGSVLNVQVSDDKNNLPLYIESELAVGSVKLILSESEGLKYDLSAKVE